MTINKPITAAQIKEMHILLSKTGLMAYKQDYMDNVCIDGRYPTSSKELYYEEAEKIINFLKKKNFECDKMRKKVISICMQSGMVINGKPDMPKIYQWVLQYGHQKKHLNKYTYHELIKLVNQANYMFKTFLKAVQHEK